MEYLNQNNNYQSPTYNIQTYPNNYNITQNENYNFGQNEFDYNNYQQNNDNLFYDNNAITNGYTEESDFYSNYGNSSQDKNKVSNLIYENPIQNETKIDYNDNNWIDKYLSNNIQNNNQIIGYENQFNSDKQNYIDYGQQNYQNINYNKNSNQNVELNNLIGTNGYTEQKNNKSNIDNNYNIDYILNNNKTNIDNNYNIDDILNNNKTNIDNNYNIDDILNNNKTNIDNNYNIDNLINNNNFINEEEEEKPAEPIHLNFMVRTKGLANVGATCYMNATLQCFFHVKRLSENLINDYKIGRSLELTYSFKNLIKELAGCKKRKKVLYDVNNYIVEDKPKDYYEPNEFKDLISRKNPLFNGIQANDSKDLIIFLLEGMDNELTERNNKNLPKENFYGKNPEEMTEANFKKIHNSIFSELFYGFQKSIMECLSCGHKDVTYSVFNFLIFPLEKVYNTLNKNNNNMNNYNFNNGNYNMINNMNYNNMYFNNMLSNNMFNINNINRNIFNNMNMNYNMFNNMNNMNYNNQNNFSAPQIRNTYPFNSLSNYSQISRPNLNNKTNLPRKLTLDNCFKENENEEILFGSNQIFCNHCRRYSKARTKNEIHKAPNVFILILNRGKGNYFQCDLDFPHRLDISKFVNNPSSPKIYELIGVISHLGKSSMDGHFIAYCKHFDMNWYLFNDGIVTPVSLKNIYKGTPYILFYQNIDLN